MAVNVIKDVLQTVEVMEDVTSMVNVIHVNLDIMDKSVTYNALWTVEVTKNVNSQMHAASRVLLVFMVSNALHHVMTHVQAVSAMEHVIHAKQATGGTSVKKIVLLNVTANVLKKLVCVLSVRMGGMEVDALIYVMITVFLAWIRINV